MNFTPIGLSYRHSNDDVREYPTNYEAVVVRSVSNIARGEYSYESPCLEKGVRATHTIIANLIEHLVNKGLMNNEEFQKVLEQNEYRPEFKLVEKNDD